MTNTAHIRSRRPAPAAAPVRRRAGLVRPVRPAPPDPVAEAAARYAREGWRVVPLNGERRPTRQGWQDGATADPERAARDCAGNAGVGILAGERRLVVLDIDGQQGEQSLTNLTLHGGSSLPATREILTPGGGRHLHFTTDAALRGRTIAPGLEIKGASRAGRPVAVPMPPSRRAYRDGDRHYAWGADGDRAPAELPATWVEELLRLQQEDDERRAEAMAGTEPRDPAQPVTDYERRWAAETLDRICAGIAGTRSGRRTAINHGALRVGGCLWALDAGEAERRLIEAGRASGWRGDVVRTVRDAVRDGAERPIGPQRSTLWDPNRPRPPGANNPGPALIRPRTHPLSRGRRMVEIESRPIEWLFAPYIPFGMLTLLCGDPGRRKSTISTDFVARATTGRDWPNRENSVGPINCLWVEAEEAIPQVLKPRLEANEADENRVIIMTADECGKYLRPIFDTTI
jgi:hypothetical protein